MRITITVYVPSPDIIDLEIGVPYQKAQTDEKGDNNNKESPVSLDNPICMGPNGKVDEDVWHNFRFTPSAKIEE